MSEDFTKLTLCERARRYDTDFPRVWELFQRFAQELLSAGRTRGSSNAIFERIRWDTAVNPDRDDEGFKLNNNFRAYYSRKWLAAHPEHPCFFAQRPSEFDAMFIIY